MNSKRRLIILHSLGRTGQENWYQSVAKTLKDRCEVMTPNLPNPSLARSDEWLAALDELKPDNETILVGHSLGGTLILRYLEARSTAITGFVLVAAPINDLARNDLHATGFFTGDFDWPKIINQAAIRLVIGSPDDHTVPFWQAEHLAHNLKAELISLTNKNHFMQAELPELTELLNQHFLKENDGQ